MASTTRAAGRVKIVFDFGFVTPTGLYEYPTRLVRLTAFSWNNNIILFKTVPGKTDAENSRKIPRNVFGEN